MALKEQDVVLYTTDTSGNKVIQMPITRIENVEGALKTINGVAPDGNGEVKIKSAPTIYSSDITYDETFSTSSKEWSYTTPKPGLVTANTFVLGEHSSMNTVNWSAYLKINGVTVNSGNGQAQTLSKNIGEVVFFAPSGTVITFGGTLQYGHEHAIRGYCNIKVLE